MALLRVRLELSEEPRRASAAKLFLIISALAEKINLTAGVIGHEGSTVLVILNGLRLLRSRKSG
jgi:Cd2+/Zn2+-exporting ATPase